VRAAGRTLRTGRRALAYARRKPTLAAIKAALRVIADSTGRQRNKKNAQKCARLGRHRKILDRREGGEWASARNTKPSWWIKASGRLAHVAQIQSLPRRISDERIAACACSGRSVGGRHGVDCASRAGDPAWSRGGQCRSGARRPVFLRRSALLLVLGRLARPWLVLVRLCISAWLGLGRPERLA